MNIIDFLNFKTIKSNPEEFILDLPITTNLLQPFGIMHGGINALLAETAASMGANLHLNNDLQVAVGIDVQTTHLHPMTVGTLRAVATPKHIGKSLQTWSVDTLDAEKGTLISTSIVNLINQKRVQS